MTLVAAGQVPDEVYEQGREHSTHSSLRNVKDRYSSLPGPRVEKMLYQPERSMRKHLVVRDHAG